MGYSFTTLTMPQKPEVWADYSPEDMANQYLVDLYNRINDLPAQHDIKILLRKCVHCILVDDDANEEIQFLNEVRRLLSEIKVSSNIEHVEIIGVLQEIYQFAVDRKINENIGPEDEEEVKIHSDLLYLFESRHQYMEESFDEEDEEVRSDNNDQDFESYPVETDEACEHYSANLSAWMPQNN